MENQKIPGIELTKETEGSKLNTGHFQPINGSYESASMDLMTTQELINLPDKAFDVEQECFVLSSEFMAMEDEYILWKEESGLRQPKKSLKETGIAEYYDGELFVSSEENSYCQEENFTA